MTDAFLLAKRLLNDEDFRTLLPQYRLVLLHAAVERANADGVFWPSVRDWASGAAVSASTVKRAIRDAKAKGLLSVEPHAQWTGRQGSSTYRFATRLLEPSDISATAPPESSTLDPPRSAGADRPQWLAAEPAEQDLGEQDQNEQARSSEQGIPLDLAASSLKEAIESENPFDLVVIDYGEEIRRPFESRSAAEQMLERLVASHPERRGQAFVVPRGHPVPRLPQFGLDTRRVPSVRVTAPHNDPYDDEGSRYDDLSDGDDDW